MTEPIRSWKVRRVAPAKGDWATIYADSALDAAQGHHIRCGSACGLARRDGETEDFALIEVEGFGQVISRCFFRTPSTRHAPLARDLADVARRLGVSLRSLEGVWEGESAHWQPRFAH